jgi:hypothetical protein
MNISALHRFHVSYGDQYWSGNWGSASLGRTSGATPRLTRRYPVAAGQDKRSIDDSRSDAHIK